MESKEALEGKRIHYGSLEEVEKERLKSQENGGLSSAVLAGIKAGNINISEGEHGCLYNSIHECLYMLYIVREKVQAPYHRIKVPCTNFSGNLQ